MAKIIKLNEQNFDKEVMESEKIVLVDFKAIWCHPCKLMEPIVEEIARDYQEKIKVGIIDVDESPKIADQYSVTSIPTIKLFKAGKTIEEFIGVQPKKNIVFKIEQHT